MPRPKNKRFLLVIDGIGFVSVMTTEEVVRPPPRKAPPKLSITMVEVQTPLVTFVKTAGFVVTVIKPLVLMFPVTTTGKSLAVKVGLPVAPTTWFVVSPKIQVYRFVASAGAAFTNTMGNLNTADTPLAADAEMVFVSGETFVRITVGLEVPLK